MLLSLGGGALVTPAMAHDPPPPLLQKLEALQCAMDAKMAQQILSELANITAPGQKWPDEWLGQKPEAALHAGTLDIALTTLKATAERFPNLREEAERIALQWDYCDVMENLHFHDLILRQQQVQKLLAADDPPLKWEGFRQWGFLTPDPVEHFVPKLLDEIRLAPEAYHLFLHQTYRQQCFPHPETGLLVSEAEAPIESVSSRAFPQLATAETQAQAYPFEWNPLCHIAKQEQDKAAKPPVKKAKTKTASGTKTVLKAQQKTQPILATTSQSERKKQREIRRKAQQQRVAARVARVATPIPSQGVKGASGAVGKIQVAQPAEGQVILPTIVTTSAGGDIPIFFEETSTQAHGTTGVIDTKKKPLRVAGNIADTVSLKDGSNSLAASVTWSPKENWLVNGNVSVKDGKPDYAWNAGYANPKPGTVSAQVGRSGSNTSASLGYKVKSDTLAKHKLSASAGLNIPANGKAKANATLQWNPKPNVYARTTVTQAVEGGKPNWNYSVGYSNPKPGKWRVEYSNYGNNKAPGDNFGDGAITVSRGWQF